MIDIHYGEILGIKPGAKLLAVYSNSIQNNNNTTRFSFIIKNSDGTLENAEMLNQTGGKDSDKNIYEVNRDGSEVNKKTVQSSYEIKSPLAENAIITAKVGEMGYIEIGYGQIDPTSHKDALTQELETEHTYYTTYQVREEFSQKKGINNIREDLKETKEHEKYGCEDITLEEADGDENTGHKHIENNYNDNILQEIKKYDENIEEKFSDKEIRERFEAISSKNPEQNLDEIIEQTKRELSEDASHMRTH